MPNELVNKNVPLLDLISYTQVNVGDSYNFDEDQEDDYWSNFDKLHDIEFLYRMIGKKDEKKLYVLKEYELESKKISLFNLRNDFLEENKHLCNNDCFLQFMFFVVMKRELTESYMKNKRIANLIIKKILQLATTDEIFRSKVEYIDISPLDDQNYIDYADHWDLKYIDERYSIDNDIQQLLYNCTDIYDVSKGFIYSNNLVNQDKKESNSEENLKLT